MDRSHSYRVVGVGVGATISKTPVRARKSYYYFYKCYKNHATPLTPTTLTHLLHSGGIWQKQGRVVYIRELT